MTTSYPAALDAFPDPTGGDRQNSVTVPHAQQHQNVNDAIEAVENELGTNPSGSSFATVRERLEGVEGDIFTIQNTAFDIDIIPDLSITHNKLAPDSVTNSKIVNGAVTASKLGVSSISSSALADDAVTRDKIAADVAGDGMQQNGNGSLSPRVDGVTIEIVGSTLRVKDGGLGEDALAAAIANALIPVGTPIPNLSNTLDDGFLWCDGTEYNRVGTYAALFAKIGDDWGAGNGTTTFNVPNLVGRILMGRDTLVTRLNEVAKVTGSEYVTLTEDQMPTHDHTTGSGGTHSHVITINADGYNHMHLGVGTIFGGTYGLVAYSHELATTIGYTQAAGYAGNQTAVQGMSPASFETTNARSTTSSGTAQNHTHGASSSSTGSHTHTVSSEGGGNQHDNLPPVAIVRWQIKY